MHSLLALLLLGPAQAGDLGFSLGYDRTINDPFLVRRGLRAGVAFAPREQLAVEATAAFYPDLGESDWAALTSQLIDNNHVSPDLSRILGQAHLRLHIFPLRSRFGPFEGALDGWAGFGATWTEDDLEALQQEGDPWAEATASQVHPCPTWGFGYQVVADIADTGAMGLRLRWDRFRYIETVSSATLETKGNIILGLEWVLWL
jgi:hypothetical protein